MSTCLEHLALTFSVVHVWQPLVVLGTRSALLALTVGPVQSKAFCVEAQGQMWAVAKENATSETNNDE